VRIADVETCDFALLPRYDTASVLRAAWPDRWERYLGSAVSRRLIAELGVAHRHLTHLPGTAPDPARWTALDLARSAVERLSARRRAELARLDAVIFASTSNPNPCNCQASLLAAACGLTGSCLDIKAGCSSGVLALLQAAVLIRAGCERVLVVAAENLSHLTDPGELRMLVTVGDGAACLLVERGTGPGFLSMVHGTDPTFADVLAVRTPFPPAGDGSRYVFEVAEAKGAQEALRARWRALLRESLAAAGLRPEQLAGCFLHQTHGAQVDALVAELGVAPAVAPRVVGDHGNMGSPTFAVALAHGFARLAPGDRYLLAAVGGGLSWCAIVAEHA
jgi:3-oxoacyl-[acyl-carrier-protein] synthase III